jgi:glycosyltransferase involved in cell wall biosynthesis
VGDDYRPRLELDEIAAQYPAEKLRLIHCLFAVEREKYRGIPEKIWNNGGVSASNIAADAALSEGYDYICKLDHDDYWLPRHLKIISETIEKTGADFVCTGAQVPGGKLPKIESSEYLVPFLPAPGGIIHSSTCYNFRTIPVRSRDACDLPSDYEKWQRMSAYIFDNKLQSYFINEVTCIWEPGTYERKK